MSDQAKGRLQTLDEADVCAVFRLVLECLDLGFDPVAWRQRLLRGLRQITDSGLCLSTIMPIDPSHQGATRPLAVADATDTYSESQYTEFLKRLDIVNDPLTPPIMSQWPIAMTELMPAFMPREQWRSYEYIQYAYLGVDIYDLLHSRVPLPASGLVSVLAITRRKDQPLFNERDRRIVELAHGELAARIAVPSDQATDAYAMLPTRLQELATHLRGPMSIKQIAQLMRLSTHTVNNYTKAIYRRLNVQSRTEIIHVMKSRDGRSAVRNELVLS